MEVRPHGHQDQIPTSAEEDDHHHSPPEKIKSVMKKVKDKAKKIKNSLTKHGHDHEEDDDDEEEEEDHGEVKIQHQMEEKEKQSIVDHDREKNDEDGEIKVPKLKRESVVKDDPFMSLEQEPNSPKSSILPSNYQSSKDTETEAGITSSFNKMNISTAVDEIKDEQPKSPEPELSPPPGYLSKISSVLISPGEEDKALSETISDALEWRKKNNAVAGEKEEKVMGEVIVSDELAKRLGSSSSSNSKLPGVSETMVERIKGTVGSWFGFRSGGADQSLGTTTTTANVMDNNNAGGQGE